MPYSRVALINLRGRVFLGIQSRGRRRSNHPGTSQAKWTEQAGVAGKGFMPYRRGKPLGGEALRCQYSGGANLMDTLSGGTRAALRGIRIASHRYLGIRSSGNAQSLGRGDA